MMIKKIIGIAICLTAVAAYSYGCTTAIISGKYTKDGRPLLWKNRDSDSLNNKLMYFDDGKYTYIGLINAGDAEGKEVWGGCNSAGFAIMNSDAYNLNTDDTSKIKDRDGIVMKMALQSCATLNDFEELLKKLPKPCGLNCNFGVIDAKGGAAYYEMSNYSFTKFDANDNKIAPLGFIIRANYAFSGKTEKGHGFIRYATAENLFYNAAITENLTAEFLINDASRCLRHSLMKTDLVKIADSENERQFVNTDDYIVRYSSASAIIVEGVKPGENADLTTIWTILGYQMNSVAIPSWVAGGKNIPSILAGEGRKHSALCDMALKLKEGCFPMKWSTGYRYLDLTRVINKENTGIRQKLMPLESSIINESNKRMQGWRKTGINRQEVQSFYEWVDRTVEDEYKRLFPGITEM